MALLGAGRRGGGVPNTCALHCTALQVLPVHGKGGWQLSHFSCPGLSPLQPWQPNPHNPVVSNGQLFNKICAGEGKHCQPGMGDEGTPEIVEKMAGDYYVTFHGYDYTRKRAARGVARTRDFVDWNVTGGEGRLSGDVMFSSEDCQWAEVPWQGEAGCIGSGQASIIKGGSGYMYQVAACVCVVCGCGVCGGRSRAACRLRLLMQVIEVADKELGCETGWNSQVLM